MGKKRLNFSTFFILLLAALLLNAQNALAAGVVLNVDGANGSIEVDDHGGFENYNELHWDGLSHTATTSLAVFDAISQDIDNVQVDDYKGDPNDDRDDTWANNQSGIQRYPGPVAGMPACIGDVAAAPGGDPSIPVSFMGANTGLDVEQFVLAGANDPFAIHVYRIINNTNTTKDIKAAHFNDFDVGSTNPNEDMGYDAGNKLVWEWESSNGYIAGTALLDGDVSNWFLEKCCTLTWGEYNDQLGFFTDDPAFNGDKNSEPADLEVDIATDLGVLRPGQSEIVVFVVAAAQGGTSALALTNLQATIQAADDCYDDLGNAAQVKLYGTLGTGGDGPAAMDSILVELDPGTGALVEQIGPVGYLVNGLAQDPTTGILYGSTSFRCSDPGPCYNGLIEIDIDSGEGMEVGVHNWGLAPGAVTNITIDLNGNMFGWYEGPGAGIDDPVSINKTTGIATIRGNSGLSTGGNSLVFDSNNNLIMYQEGDGFYNINRINGAATKYAETPEYVLAHHGAAYLANMYGVSGPLADPDMWPNDGVERGIVVLDLATGNIIDRFDTIDKLHTLAFVVTAAEDIDELPFFFKNVFPGVFIKDSGGGGGGSSGCFIDTLLD